MKSLNKRIGELISKFPSLSDISKDNANDEIIFVKSDSNFDVHYIKDFNSLDEITMNNIKLLFPGNVSRDNIINNDNLRRFRQLMSKFMPTKIDLLASDQIVFDGIIDTLNSTYGVLSKLSCQLSFINSAVIDLVASCYFVRYIVSKQNDYSQLYNELKTKSLFYRTYICISDNEQLKINMLFNFSDIDLLNDIFDIDRSLSSELYFITSNANSLVPLENE